MDGDGAVREVAQVYEHIKLQQPVLLHYSSSQSPSPSTTTTTTRLAHNLLGQALRALNVALSVMKQQQPAATLSCSGSGPPAVTLPAELVKAEPGPGGVGLLPSNSSQETATRSGNKRRRSLAMAGRNKPSTSSWVDFTTVPYEDGYQWRKYGEKKINGAGHTRSYFRCTYKNDIGCRATKHVQQSDDIGSDPPVFQVTYNGNHTCGGGGGECTATAPITSSAIVANSSCDAAAMVKQEPPTALLPPPLVAAEPYSALPFDRTTTTLCQDLLVPVGMRRFCGTVRDCHGGVATSTTSSCISSESSDEYSAAGGEDMAARMAGVEAPADDVPFNDFELFLLCNSFKHY
ncbi:transcription factor WRKY45-1-like [Miscanthus floridulus]|uniref:transcription factor WRKY45-1-like n=1 Tax=Miscanthus floridulus TaxID=154761 RepID=UPI003457DD2F